MTREETILDKLEKEINLKELQIKSLLAITQAINGNINADGLFKMYKTFLSWDMGIERMALFIQTKKITGPVPQRLISQMRSTR